MMLAVIRDHESGGHQGEDDETQSEGGTAEEQGSGIRLVNGQRGL